MKLTVTLLALFCLFSVSSPAQQTSVPYFDNFESGAPGWTPSVDIPCGTNFELGIPSVGFTLGAFSGQECWDVNLNANYTNNATCYLYSPVFNFTNAYRSTISFWVMYNAEFMWDYLSVQVSVDKGDSWQYMPFPYLISPDGGIQKWIQSSLTVTDLYGYSDVQFRFIFISDASIIYDGYSIDDFRIEMDPVGINEADQAEAFSIYPNPSNGEVRFWFDAITDNDAFVTIYDATGKNIFEQKATAFNTQSSLNLDLPNGVYSVVLNSNNSMSAQKLVIAK